MSFWSSYWWPAATALIGFVYVALLLRQWLRRRKPHQLAWAVGFLMYAVAAAFEFYSEYTQSWNPTVYRIYIVIAASMVGFLGLGTLFLISKDRLWPRLYLVFNVLAVAVFFWGAFTTDLVDSALKPGIVVGGNALGASMTFPRVMSFVFNIPGSLLLLGGSAWSVVRFWPKKEYRYRSWANVLIFVGTLCIAAAGSMARAGRTEGLYFGEMIASAILLTGFLLAGTLERGVATIRERREREKAARS